MFKFEVGDKVRRVEGTSSDMKAGDVGTIKEIYTVNNDIWMILKEWSGRHLMERFELVEKEKKEELTIEEKIIGINKIFNKISFDHNNSELNYAKEREQKYYEEIKRYERYLKETWVFYKEQMNKVKMLNSLGVEKDFTDDIKAIFNNKYVIDMEASERGKQIIVITDYIDIYDEEGNKFRGNKYKLFFDFGDMTCYIEGLDSDYNRESYWTENDPHPHVDGNSGEACWGSAGSMLVENMNNYELYASFIVVLNFLQQVNTSDPAGAYIRNWDCIDEEDNDIENPYDFYARCHICEEGMDEDNSFYCEDCGKHMCDDHAYWIDASNIYVCECCFEEDYNVCDNCSERIYKDNAYWHGNDVYCEDCYNNRFDECCECGEAFEKDEMIKTNGEYYCSECHEELFVDCQDCGRTVDKDDTFYCNECGYTYCTNCAEEVEEGICEECYEGDEE